MAEKNYGKQFEKQIFEAFKRVPQVSIDRIPDQVTKYKGSSSNICDFIAYKYPILFYLECKSVHGSSLSIHSVPKPDKKGELHGFYGNIRDNQWEGLMAKSQVQGVQAGVLVWWVDKDVTKYIPISTLAILYASGQKSIRYDYEELPTITIQGKKKRTLFNYDMAEFLKNF